MMIGNGGHTASIFLAGVVAEQRSWRFRRHGDPIIQKQGIANFDTHVSAFAMLLFRYRFQLRSYSE
jgi:hypothetical protein